MTKETIASTIMKKALAMTDSQAEIATAVAAAMQSGYELGRLSAQNPKDNKASA